VNAGAGNLGETVAAWTLHYEANPAAARERIVHMGHGIPEGHHAELLGASLALTSPQDRCVHWGDRRYCVQCLTDPERVHWGDRRYCVQCLTDPEHQ
jgi:hypothetical protein